MRVHLSSAFVLLALTSCEGRTLDPAGEGEGEGEGAEVATCQDRCTSDAFCIGVGGTGCVDGRCAFPPLPEAEPCTIDGECIARTVGNAACSATSPCVGDQFACMQVDPAGTGAGECALLPDADGSCPVGSLRDVVDVTGAALQICGPDRACLDGACGRALCRSDADCGGSRCSDDGACVQCLNDADCTLDLTVCRPDGTCGCASDADCGGSREGKSAVGSLCLVATGVCGCADDSECAFYLGGDLCFDGRCGCSDASQCSDIGFVEGQTWVCE